MNLSKIRKAIVAGGGAFLSALGVAVANNSGQFTWPIVIAAVGTGIMVGLGTWRVPNEPQS